MNKFNISVEEQVLLVLEQQKQLDSRKGKSTKTALVSFFIDF